MGKRMIIITQHLWISIFGDEGSHAPHAHVVFKGKKVASINIVTLEVYQSDLDSKVEKKALELIAKNADVLLEEYRRQNEN